MHAGDIRAWLLRNAKLIILVSANPVQVGFIARDVVTSILAFMAAPEPNYALEKSKIIVLKMTQRC